MLKKCRKILCIVFIIMVASLLCVPTFYAENDGDVVVTDPAYDPEPEPEVTDPVVYTTAAPDVVYTTAPVETQAVYTTAAPVYTTEYQEPTYYYEEPTTYYYEEPTYYEAPVTEYQNQDEYYDKETTEPTEDATSLYDSGSDIDDTELNSKNWKSIAAELAESKESDDTESPFSHIKNADEATGFEAFLNNLNWVLTAGIGCIILAVISLAVFIIFTRKKKRAVATAVAGKKADKGRKKSDTEKDLGAKATASRRGGSHAGAEGKVYTPRSNRSTSDYGDDYGSSEGTDTPAPKANKAKKKLSQDTAEINITKRRF
jgi:hypothetical protein